MVMGGLGVGGAILLGSMAAASVAGVGVAIYYSEQNKAANERMTAAQQAANAAALKVQQEALDRQAKQEQVNLILGVAGLVLSVASIAVIYYMYRRGQQ